MNIFQYDYSASGSSLGLGFWNKNRLAALDTYTSGNINISGTITSPTITTMKSANDTKAPLSHTHSISEVSKLQTSLDSKAIPLKIHLLRKNSFHYFTYINIRKVL